MSRVSDQSAVPHNADALLTEDLGPKPTHVPNEDGSISIVIDAATQWWIAVSKVDGLRIRSRPTNESRVMGLLDRGGFKYADSRKYGGNPTQACGGLTDKWVAVWINDVWGYVPDLCVDWRPE